MSPWPFIFRTAWRDARAGGLRLLLFPLAIVLGTAALVAIGSLTENLRRSLDSEALHLIGADLEITTRSRPTPAVHDLLREIGGRTAQETTMATMAVFPSASGQTRLITLRAIESSYPFYGTLHTRPESAAALLHATGSPPQILLEETLLSQFALRPGDPVTIGTTTFTIAGALLKIPGTAPAFATLSPQAIISLTHLDSTGLLGVGSLFRFRSFHLFPPGTPIPAILKKHKPQLENLKLTTDTVADKKRTLGRIVENAESFLNLSAFIALFLGAIGVATTMHVYVREKIPSLAVLRCLGASAWQGFTIYLLQAVGLGLIGGIGGALLGVLIQQGIGLAASAQLPFPVGFQLEWPQIIKGLTIGLGTTVLFTLLPLLPLRRIAPLAVLRGQLSTPTQRDPLRLLLWLIIPAASTGLALTLTPRWQTAIGFITALFLVLGLLYLLAHFTSRAARILVPITAPMAWHHAIANLHRPGHRTALLLISLGLGTFLISTMALTRATLLTRLHAATSAQKANLLFFDIQPDQLTTFEHTLRSTGAPLISSAPIVTMTLSHRKGTPISQALKDPTLKIPAWTLRREYRSTYRPALNDTEKLTTGAFTGTVAPDTTPVPISLEQGLARDMQLQCGDTLTFDVQGLPIPCVITSLREVDWQSMQPNFFILFPTGILEAAPSFHLTATRATTAAQSASIQQAIVAALPNVSAVDLSLVLETIDLIVSRIELVVRVMALLTIVTGLIVICGAIHSSRHQRLREAVLLRTLGASHGQIQRIQLIEYAILGGLGALTGVLLALPAHALLARYVFKAPAVWALGGPALIVATVAVLTMVIGWLACRSLRSHTPLQLLRSHAG